jgi:hypothetical protein
MTMRHQIARVAYFLLATEDISKVVYGAVLEWWQIVLALNQ